MNLSNVEDCQAIIRAMPDLVFVLTESGKYAAVLGGDFSEQYHSGGFLEELTLYDVLPKVKADWFKEKIAETLATDKLMVFEYSLSADDVENIEHDSGPKGDLRFEGRVCPLKSLRDGERAVVWVARNITERYKLEQQLIHQAEFDTLSQAYNRRKLFKCLNDAFFKYRSHNENISFINIDLDNFKSVNDTFGHSKGDEVICDFVKLCQSQLRDEDVFGRIGGDEFGIIYQGSLEQATAFSDELRRLISEPTCGADVTLSVGISEFKHDDTTVDQVYQRADIALYRAKRAGKNSCQLLR